MTASRTEDVRYQGELIPFHDICCNMSVGDLLTTIVEPRIFSDGRQRPPQGYNLQSGHAAVKRTS